MSEEIAIRVENLSKVYKLYNSPIDRLKESLHPFRRQYHHDFYALSDISFEIKKGESVGIIGKNGSGKSTLLKILTRVLTPTSGSVTINGKVSALLELGAGFNPELSGIENIFFNGMLMGYSREEMEERLDGILSFADIGEFVHQPVKTYSSGMFVRLAFAVAISVEPEILIVDEALSVGDIFFQQKCYSKIDEFKLKKMTILFVSHGMSDVMQLCEKAILLKSGRISAMGNSQNVARQYMLEVQNPNEVVQEAIPNSDDRNLVNRGTSYWPSRDAFVKMDDVEQITTGIAMCLNVALLNSERKKCLVFEQGEKAYFYYEFELFDNISVPIGGLGITNAKNILVHAKTTLEYDSHVPMYVSKGSRLRFSHEIQLDIAPGDYTYYVGLSTMSKNSYESRSSVTYGQLIQKISRLCHTYPLGPFTVVVKKLWGKVQHRHHGICDLPGSINVCVNSESKGNMRLLVVEYPKCGGSWYVSVLGDILAVPKRDIYVDENYRSFDVRKHPWYLGYNDLGLTQSCVIKSHEGPDTQLHNFPAKYVHLVRDGRDVIVSKYFFEKDFCVNNGILERFDDNFDDYVEKISYEWNNYVTNWMNRNIIICKYEDLLTDPVGTTSNLLKTLDLDADTDLIVKAFELNTMDKMKKSIENTYKHNTFVRKGIAGDWINHFSDKNKSAFKKNAGELLIKLGYENTMNW